MRWFTGSRGGSDKGMGASRGRGWLIGMLLGLLALAVQVGTVAANGSGPICLNVQCISNVQVTPHGQYANFSFHTNIPGIAIVQVAEVAPNKLADGTVSYTGVGTDSFG